MLHFPSFARVLLAASVICGAGFAANPAPAADAPGAPAGLDARPRAPNDASEYRRLTLPNGIRVILLSDPKLNVSSASLAVGVGSLADPPQRQGLAHFLEHMLFLGTEKYPDVSDFGGYLSSNGGRNNAYTALDRTNYFFEIRHEAFEGALDRFAQFFIAPLFAPEFTEREMNAVNSEFQKNLESDNWREYALRNNALRPDHPAHKFSIGNRETLGGTRREELLAFYENHYSANLMTLALTGRASLDQLEQWARSRFGAVPNRKLAELQYPADILPPRAALRTLRMEPLKDLRHLSLMFPLPDLRSDVRSKPGELVAVVLGSEAPGSLLAQLKAEGLATGLTAGAEVDTRDYGSFELQIALTSAGLEKRSRVLELVFAAIDLLKREGVPPYLFSERQTLARLDELYRDKGEGMQRATQLSNAVMDYGLDIAERVPYLWTRQDPAAVRTVLEALRPDNLLVTVVAKGLATDKTAPWFGTRYGYSEDAGPAYRALLTPPTLAALTLPPPNPFVPTHNALLPPEPVRLIDEPALSLYYAQDMEFERPMLAHLMRLRLPRSMASLHNAVLLRFYEACVEESLSETTYAAAEAGLRFHLGASLEGVTLSVDGYDDTAGRLLDAVTAGLVDFQLSEERFAALKDRMLRELAAFERADAYQTLRETRRSTLNEFYYRPDEQLPEARGVTLAQVRDFAKRLYTRGKLEALSYGNVDAAAAQAAVRRVAASLKIQPVPEADLLRPRVLASAAGDVVRTSEKLKVNNSAFRREYVLGADTPELRAATPALASFVSEPFYSELRTRQQLGYIVGGGAAEDRRSEFAYFIVQSGEYPADVLEARADAFIRTLPDKLAALPDASWKSIVAGVRAKLEEKDKSIAERAGRLFELAYERNADWGRRQATLAALDKLTQARAAEILRQALSPETGRVRTFLGFAREHEPKGEPVVTFTDTAAWKARQRFE